MSAMDELFTAAKRAGVGVLVINSLQIGDVITAENVAGGDVNASRNVTIPREALSSAHRSAAVAIGESGPCVPYTGPNPWAWRVTEQEHRNAEWQKQYAAECEARWQVIDDR